MCCVAFRQQVRKFRLTLLSCSLSSSPLPPPTNSPRADSIDVFAAIGCWRKLKIDLRSSVLWLPCYNEKRHCAAATTIFKSTAGEQHSKAGPCICSFSPPSTPPPPLPSRVCVVVCVCVCVFVCVFSCSVLRSPCLVVPVSVAVCCVRVLLSVCLSVVWCAQRNAQRRRRRWLLACRDDGQVQYFQVAKFVALFLLSFPVIRFTARLFAYIFTTRASAILYKGNRLVR